jgi:hypothetical protein
MKKSVSLMIKVLEASPKREEVFKSFCNEFEKNPKEVILANYCAMSFQDILNLSVVDIAKIIITSARTRAAFACILKSNDSYSRHFFKKMNYVLVRDMEYSIQVSPKSNMHSLRLSEALLVRTARELAKEEVVTLDKRFLVDGHVNQWRWFEVNENIQKYYYPDKELFAIKVLSSSRLAGSMTFYFLHGKCEYFS